jgi:hypothetical protein
MNKNLIERFEREASEFTKRDISLSKESFYSGEQRSLYKRLVIDGTETRHHIDLMDLQESVGRGRFTDRVRAVAGIILLG